MELIDALINSRDTIRELLESETIDINFQDITEGKTALSFASHQGYLEVVRKLLVSGADVNSKDRCERTPLMYASSGGHKEIVVMLLKNGAEIDSQTKYDGWTALMYASVGAHIEVIRELLERGADPDIINDNGYSFLF